MKKSKKGFTLVELLIVIIILAIIVAITVPFVAEITESSKRKAFYLYAVNLVSKATEKYVSTYSNLDEYRYDDWKSAKCVTYNIKEDLAIKNTGNYEGWVQISRNNPDATDLKELIAYVDLSVDHIPTDEENEEYRKQNNKYIDGIMYPKYCISAAGTACTPERDLSIQENQYTLRVSKTIKEGEQLCANYQKAVKNGNNYELTTTSTTCTTFAQAKASYEAAAEDETDVNIKGRPLPQDYKYNVILTFKDNSYAISNLNMEGINEQNFYSILNEEMTSRVALNNVVKKLEIEEPVCPGVDKEPDVLGTGKYVEASTTVVTEPPVKEEVLLKSLKISDYDIGFNSGQSSYSLEVPNYINSVTVYAEPMVPSTKVTYDSNVQLVIGRNTISISLEDENGGRNRYIVYVNRLNSNTTRTTRSTRTKGVVVYTTREITTVEGAPDPNLPESNAQLEFLTISKHQDFDFNPDIYYYDLKLESGEDMLYLNYRAKNPNATVIVTGNSNLKNGSQVEILVRSENEYYTKSYIINIYRETSKISFKLLFRILAIVLGIVLVVVLIWLTLARRSMRPKKNKQIQVITKTTQNSQTKSVFDQEPKKVVVNTNQNNNNNQNNN